MNSTRNIVKRDNILFFVTLFWGTIYGIIIFMFVGLAMPTKIQLSIIAFVAVCLLYYMFLKAVRSKSIDLSVIAILLYVLIGPIYCYFAIGLSVMPYSDTIITEPKLAMAVFLLAMMLPYGMIGTGLLISKDFSKLLLFRRNRIKLSLSISIAFVTIMYAFIPLLKVDDFFMSAILIVPLLPFAANILGICYIEYLNLKEHEEGVDNYDV